MTSTFTSYNLINKDLTKSLARTAKETDVKRDTDYYNAHVGDVKSIDDFLKNDKIYRYAMKAYGLEDMTYAKGLIRKILEGGVSDNRALANRMSDPRFKALAKAFDFKALGAATTTSTAVQKDTVAAFTRQRLETDAGDQNEGVRLALYFQRNAPNVTSAFGILADRALLKVVQTAFDISPLSSLQTIDVQAASIKKFMNIKDLQDPTKVQKLIQKFAAKFDLANTQGTTDPVLTLFNPPSASTSPVAIGDDVRASILNLKLGGF